MCFKAVTIHTHLITKSQNLISHNGIILYQWEFLRARLDEGEGLYRDCHGLPWTKTKTKTK